MTLTETRQVLITREEIRAYVRDYQRYALGARPPKREEVLVQRQPGKNPWEDGAAKRASIEGAWQRLPLRLNHQLFMYSSLLGSSFRTGGSGTWKERCSDWWDVSEHELSKAIEDAVETMYRDLNRRGLAITSTEAI